MFDGLEWARYFRIFPQENGSNATTVLIRNVSFGLSGQFSCEVTADAPLYSTATAFAQMQVVGEYLRHEYLTGAHGYLTMTNRSCLISRWQRRDWEVQRTMAHDGSLSLRCQQLRTHQSPEHTCTLG